MRMMTTPPTIAERIEAYIGAHAVPRRAGHERERSVQRELVAVIVALWWLDDFLTGNPHWSAAKALGLCIAIATLLGWLARQVPSGTGPSSQPGCPRSAG